MKRIAMHESNWTWMTQIRGITGRGFVYQLNDQSVVGMPTGSESEGLLERLMPPTELADLVDDEQVWKIANLQLVGILMHDRPIVYNNHPLLETREESSTQTRGLDRFETKSLENLRVGAERIIEWDANEKSLRVLGAIRAGETCLRCHEVKRGTLLGAFAYRIQPVAQPE